MSDVTEVGKGKTAFGGEWKVGTDGDFLLVIVDGIGLVLSGAERDRFTEAVARAAMPGQASGNSAATCWHCRKPIARCDSVPGQHIGCGSGHGWIHTDPEQWGHSCEPRSGAPYAQPAAQVRVKHGPACGCTPCKAEPSYEARRAQGQASS